MVDLILKILPFAIVAWFWNSTYVEYENHESRYNTQKNRIPGLDIKIKKSTKELAEIDEVKKNITEYEAKIEQYNQEIEEIKVKIPPLEDKTKILDEFSKTVNTLNIKDSIFRPKYVKENAGGIYYSNGIEFEASGTYLQFLMLFERLNQSERILNVADLKLKTNKNTDVKSRYNMITLSSTIESFHYNDVKKRKEKKEIKRKNRRRRR